MKAIDPLYSSRHDWSLDVLAAEMASTDAAPILMGHSWGGAIAALAAARAPARALILLDGGYVGASDSTAFGANPDPEIAIAKMRLEHLGFRWESWDDYTAWVRPQMHRWNPQLEEMVRSGMREINGQILPPFDADELEQIVRAYQRYDPAQVLLRLPEGLPVLLVVPSEPAEHEEARQSFIKRFLALRPTAAVERAASGHDVIIDLGPALGFLVADWLDSVLER